MLKTLKKIIDKNENLAEALNRTNFQSFLNIVNIENFDTYLVRVLVERWWDTINTFHIPCGERTFTPINFTMITGS